MTVIVLWNFIHTDRTMLNSGPQVPSMPIKLNRSVHVKENCTVTNKDTGAQKPENHLCINSSN